MHSLANSQVCCNVLGFMKIVRNFTIKFIYCLLFRLDGQVDVVDGPKPIKPKETNITKSDKNIKTELSANKNLGK